MARALGKFHTVPYWLGELAKENNINFLQVLQEALKQYMDIRVNR